MKADPVLFLAYAYGGHIGKPASEVLNLPIDELHGYVAFCKRRSELIENAG